MRAAEGSFVSFVKKHWALVYFPVDTIACYHFLAPWPEPAVYFTTSRWP